MPAARGETPEKGLVRRNFVEVKVLRVELRREGLDLRRVERVGAAGEMLPDREVVEGQERLGLSCILYHRAPLFGATVSHGAIQRHGADGPSGAACGPVRTGA